MKKMEDLFQVTLYHDFVNVCLLKQIRKIAFVTVYFCLLFLQTGCISYQVDAGNQVANQKLSERCIYFYSDDIMLNEIIRQENEKCIEYDTIVSVDVFFINSQVHSSKSALYSLSTLTLGTFYEWDSEAVLYYTVTDFQGTALYSEHMPVQYRMRTVMPPYLGLILTVSSTVLNRYKVPEVIRYRCIIDQEEPHLLDIKREDYCQEYKILLEEVWSRASLSFQKNTEKDI